ncbi:hypothetical protein PtA15_15A218 [Puccinia triticina]|uniref:Uncharacterized protein n=1 Tax=Puccinia triticina TaxID=208348 RepID=A0ABY7D664_9BASI|nr:uncharacterized protein PtA15_15A218 [Puccinia triticina]WAQ91826.1 hypothetical protein PtA15_15A218 [Puccinia triticina]
MTNRRQEISNQFKPGDTTSITAIAESYKSLLGNPSNKQQAAANLADPGEIKLLNPPKRQDTGAWSKELLTEMVRRGLAAEGKGNEALALMYFNISSGLGKPGPDLSGKTQENLPPVQLNPTSIQQAEKDTWNQFLAVPTPNPVAIQQRSTDKLTQVGCWQRIPAETTRQAGDRATNIVASHPIEDKDRVANQAPKGIKAAAGTADTTTKTTIEPVIATTTRVTSPAKAEDATSKATTSCSFLAHTKTLGGHPA